MNGVITSFLIGGLLVGSTRYLSGIIGPEYASLVGGLPVGLIAPYFLDTPREKIRFLWGYRHLVLLFAIILVEMYYLLHRTELSAEWIAGILLLSWGIVSTTFVLYSQKSS
jgi:hypothetical protein